jgi:enoyl-CoA hydratase/carnithine racemase
VYDSVEGIHFSIDAEGVGLIELDRPRVKNAFTFEMIDAWADFLEHVNDNNEVRAVVLTGRGGAFCAGVDLAQLDDVSTEPLQRKYMLSKQIHRVARAVEALDKPLIAAVTGPAVGAGMDMALMCDMRFAGESAVFTESYIKVGLVPGDGGCYFLPRLVGPAKALELLLSGSSVRAAEAERLGLVNRVLPDSEVLSETIEFARALASRAPVPLGMIKRAVYQSIRSDLGTSLDLISSHMAVVMSTNDYREARRAVADKDVPTFEGR